MKPIKGPLGPLTPISSLETLADVAKKFQSGGPPRPPKQTGLFQHGEDYFNQLVPDRVDGWQKLADARAAKGLLKYDYRPYLLIRAFTGDRGDGKNPAG